MEYTYAVLVLNETGAELNERNITAVLEAAGATPETSRVKAMVAALEGVDLGSLPAVAGAAPGDSGDSESDGEGSGDATEVG